MALSSMPHISFLLLIRSVKIASFWCQSIQHPYTQQSRHATQAAAAADEASFDYPSLLWSAASEALGVILAMALLEKMGRKGTQAGTYILTAIGAGIMGMSAFGLPHKAVVAGAIIAR